MKKRRALLGIDLQNDFILPSGALTVKGSEHDVVNIVNFLERNGKSIDYIALTLDSHQPIHIANPTYWRNENGEMPSLYSIITSNDVAQKKWIPQYNKEKAYDYLKLLSENDEVCTIWPPHCILGTEGWALNKKLTDALYAWCVDNNKSYELFYKGFNQATEHYSIFRAAVIYDDAPETKLNKELLDKLNSFDEVLIVGEAADFCVASSLNDILKEASELAKKTVMLTDTMSWIITDNQKAIGVFERAKLMGVTFTTSLNYNL